MTNNSLLDSITFLSKSGELPTKDEVLTTFAHHGYLFLANRYLNDAFEMVQQILLDNKELNHLEKYPMECVVYSQTMRVKRYLQGLSFLSQKYEDQGLFHCIDSYYPILKSLLELLVEVRMVHSYLYEFGDDQKQRREIADRVLNYSELSRRKNNYKFNFDIGVSRIPEELMPNDIREYIKTHKKEHLEKNIEVAKRIGKKKVKDIRHWYPVKDSQGKDIIKKGRSDFGTMRWRCQDVLGQYLPHDLEKEHWSVLYDTLYELLNRYSHPVLGYDDNFRNEKERLFDLFQVLCQVIITLDFYVLPGIISELKIRIENNPDALKAFSAMQKAKEILLPFYAFSSCVVNVLDDKCQNS